MVYIISKLYAIYFSPTVKVAMCAGVLVGGTVCVLPLAVAWEALISSPGVEAARTT